MNKTEVKERLIEVIKEKILLAQQSYNATKDLRQCDDLKSESKWDTRGIEAGYLAGAQKKRIDELKIELTLIENLEIASIRDNGPIIVGSLVTLLCNEDKSTYFLTSVSGGITIQINKTEIKVVSTNSPIGKSILGLELGDAFEFVHHKSKREYEVTSIK